MSAVVTYDWPVVVAGGTTPPTAGQVASLVSGLGTWLDADLTMIMTHNFGLSTVELTAQFPIVSRQTDPSNAGTINPVVTVTKATNSVTLTKASAAGSGGTFQFFIERPNTMVR